MRAFFPKHEIRISKSETSSKYQIPMLSQDHWDFVFRACLGFRASDFEFGQTLKTPKTLKKKRARQTVAPVFARGFQDQVHAIRGTA
jgi:hypothetical protein